jgi:hypothetical protein
MLFFLDENIGWIRNSVIQDFNRVRIRFFIISSLISPYILSNSINFFVKVEGCKKIKRKKLPLLHVLALKKSRAKLRCQIKRLKKTDPEEPFRLFITLIIEIFSSIQRFSIDSFNCDYFSFSNKRMFVISSVLLITN